jgi:hypothetical protein
MLRVRRRLEIPHDELDAFRGACGALLFGLAFWALIVLVSCL